MRVYQTFTEFWPFYLYEHRNGANRRLHVLGTSLAIFCLINVVVTGRLIFLLLAPLLAYACAWTGHWQFERNRPATFTYPIWSLMADFKMFALICTGGYEKEAARVLADFTPPDQLN